MSKVWLVYKESGVYEAHNIQLVEVCATPGVANLVITHISAEIQYTKNKYEKEYGSNFEDDMKYVNGTISINMDSEKFNIIEDRLLEFRLKNPIVDVSKTFIEEKEVKY